MQTANMGRRETDLLIKELIRITQCHSFFNRRDVLVSTSFQYKQQTNDVHLPGFGIRLVSSKGSEADSMQLEQILVWTGE